MGQGIPSRSMREEAIAINMTIISTMSPIHDYLLTLFLVLVPCPYPCSLSLFLNELSLKGDWVSFAHMECF